MTLIDNSFGKTFTPAMVVMGYLVIAFGAIGILANPIVGVIFIFVGVFFALSKNGIQIVSDRKVYRTYTNILGMKFGKWQSWEKYPYLSILKRSISTVAFSRANIATTTSENTYYDIFLLTANHRGKFMIQRSTDKETAKAAALDLASKLNVEYVTYSPTISAKTQARRTNRR